MHTQGELTVITDAGCRIDAPDGEVACTNSWNVAARRKIGECRANAARLTLCWNMHDELVGALRAVHTGYVSTTTLADISALLAKLNGAS